MLPKNIDITPIKHIITLTKEDMTIVVLVFNVFLSSSISFFCSSFEYFNNSIFVLSSSIYRNW